MEDQLGVVFIIFMYKFYFLYIKFTFLFHRSIDFDLDQFSGNQLPVLIVGTKLVS